MFDRILNTPYSKSRCENMSQFLVSKLRSAVNLFLQRLGQRRI